MDDAAVRIYRSRKHEGTSVFARILMTKNWKQRKFKVIFKKLKNWVAYFMLKTSQQFLNNFYCRLWFLKTHADSIFNQ